MTIPRLRPYLLVLALVAALLTVAPPAAASAAACPCSIFAAGAVPQVAADPEFTSVEVGVKFRADVAGQITGIRFYKGAGNTGTHVGNLWNTSGANLGTVTFTGESATGWQTATFASPIAISADTTYVASYYAPNGRYAVDAGGLAAGGVDNPPLRALRDGEDGGNGVYRYGAGGGYPSSTWEGANYWVDVVFAPGAPDTAAPSVTATSPASGATGVATTSTVSAVLSEPAQAAAITVAGVTGTSAYHAATRTLTFTPGALAASTSYTATVSGARDAAGNTMAPYSWSFTTAAAGGSGCPCSLWPATATPATVTVSDNSAVELGVRFRASTAGFVTGIRFYKGVRNIGTHTGSLWTSTGTRLSTVTFTGETASGWQTATLPGPVAVAANTTYVASYHTDAGFYSVTGNGLAAPVTRGPLTAPASTSGNGNGLYRYGASAFPTSTYQASNYWVDVVFTTTAEDTTAPVLLSRAPAPGSSGVATTSAITAGFSEPVTAAAIAVTGPSGPVPGALSYDATTATAIFTPSAALAHSAAYTVTVSDARDAAGNVMTPVTWSFTTSAPPPPPPDQGPGGPILVVKSAATGASGFTSFAAEVLRAEGLNEFATVDLAAVTPALLGQYDVVLLGATPLTADQVTMLTTWVTGGGNLIAFRPDKQLASLLGLTATSGTLAEAYLRVDTASAPGAGITNQTVQFHSAADRYTLAGARAVATLYSSATTATVNPAVTLAEVGTAGGQAAAFTFDLPRSLVYTRQGNPAWERQNRDNRPPVRSNDLYFGANAADWVDLGKVAVPQADEQQRLLANLIATMNADRKPLPRFWYFPRSLKAVVVATGDDHASGGTAGRFDQYLANSPAGCSVDDWQCPRFTSYIYPSTPLSNASAATYQSRGFEVGLHLNTNCSDYTAASITNNLTDQLATFRDKYNAVAPPATNRTHCIVWSDWSSQASAEGAHGIRLDTNYYYWPDSWVADRPGFMTGSGMPMRFAGINGGLIDVYQAATQMTDESGQSYPYTPDQLLGAALGPLGYYGAFTANMHTDQTTTWDSDQVLASAQRQGVPIVTGKQLLTWLDGRNASSYANLSWSGSTLSFTVNVGTGANGLTGMVPTAGPGGRSLSTLTRAGTAVPFTRTTIKGIEYAMFSAVPGAYEAGYAAAPAVAVSASAVADGTTAEVTVASGTASSAAVVEFGASPGRLSRQAVDGTQAAKRTVRLSGLEPGSTYYYRVRVTGPGGRSAVSPVQKVTTAAADERAPVASGVSVTPRADGTAAVSWRTSEPAAATVLLGAEADALNAWPGERDGTRHSVVATRLEPGETYHYRVRSVDAAGNESVWPAYSRPPATFVSAAVGVADVSGPQFRTGSASQVEVGADGVRLAERAASGSFVSRVMDVQQMVTWDRVTYQSSAPAGSRVRVFVRTGSTSSPDSSWSSWAAVSSGDRVRGDSRYAQYRVELSRSRAAAGPALHGVSITSNGEHLEHPTEK